MSFGKVAKDNTPSLEVHDRTARRDAKALAAPAKGAVQFGSRAAGSRRVRGPGAPQEPEAGGRGAGGMEVDGPQPRRGEDEEDEVEEPVPIREGGNLPVTHEVEVPVHEKAVTALSIDPKGSRMAVGSMDGTIKLFDFAGMNEEMRSFRSMEPAEGYGVQSLAFNKTGGMILVVSSDSHARIYDRDGSSKPIQYTVKGDMYVRDMTHTKGHTQMLTCGVWHPLNPEQWITSSLDGTLRIWDLNATPVGMDQLLPSVHVLKCLDKRGVCIGGASGRTGGLHPTCCAFNAVDGKTIAGGCTDGSVQLFFEKARYMKPDKVLRTAHTAAVSHITFAGEPGVGSTMVTRSLDGTVKVWDCRMLSDAKGPLHTFGNLPTEQEKSGVCVSADGKHLVVGTSSKTVGGYSSSVRVFDAKTFDSVRTLDFAKRAPTLLAWPREQNQIFVGTSAGSVSVLYNPATSKKGAMYFVGKKVRAKDLGLAEQEGRMGPIFNMSVGEDIQRFYATGHGNMTRIRNQEARHNQKTVTPLRPQETVGPIGKQTDSANFAALAIQAGAKRLNLKSERNIEADSQKALLKYADKAKAWGLFDKAYEKSGDKVLDFTEEQSEGDQRMQLALSGDFCRKCGQKVCRCTDYTVIPKKQRTS